MRSRLARIAEANGKSGASLAIALTPAFGVSGNASSRELPEQRDEPARLARKPRCWPSAATSARNSTACAVNLQQFESCLMAPARRQRSSTSFFRKAAGSEHLLYKTTGVESECVTITALCHWNRAENEKLSRTGTEPRMSTEAKSAPLIRLFQERWVGENRTWCKRISDAGTYAIDLMYYRPRRATGDSGKCYAYVRKRIDAMVARGDFWSTARVFGTAFVRFAEENWLEEARPAKFSFFESCARDRTCKARLR